MTDQDSALAAALTDCVGKTLKSVTVKRVEGDDGSHPTITFRFTDGHQIALRSMDDYEKISWVEAVTS